MCARSASAGIEASEQVSKSVKYSKWMVYLTYETVSYVKGRYSSAVSEYMSNFELN